MIKKLLYLPLLIILISCEGQSEMESQESGNSADSLTIVDENHSQSEFISTFEECISQNSVEFYPDLMGEREKETYYNYLSDMNLDQQMFIRAEYTLDSSAINIYIANEERLTEGFMIDLQDNEKYIEVYIESFNNGIISAGRYETDTDMNIGCSVSVVFMEGGQEKMKGLEDDFGLTYLTLNTHEDGQLCGSIEVLNMDDAVTKRFSFNCPVEGFNL